MILIAIGTSGLCVFPVYRQVCDFVVTFYLWNKAIVYNIFVDINVIFLVSNLPANLI